MGKPSPVDDFDRSVVIRRPSGAIGDPVDFHMHVLRQTGGTQRPIRAYVGNGTRMPICRQPARRALTTNGSHDAVRYRSKLGKGRAVRPGESELKSTMSSAPRNIA